MHALERESGVVLFERVSSGVRLTEAGGSLVAHANAILARVSEAEAELRAIKAGRLGRLRLGSFPTATDVFVAHAVEVFRREHPGIDVHFEAGRPTESLSRLKALELDMAVIFALRRWDATSSAKGKAGFRREEIKYIPLFDEPYLLVVPPDHRFADTDAVQVSELEGERIMGSPPELRPMGTRPAARLQARRLRAPPRAALPDIDFSRRTVVRSRGKGRVHAALLRPLRGTARRCSQTAPAGARAPRPDRRASRRPSFHGGDGDGRGST